MKFAAVTVQGKTIAVDPLSGLASIDTSTTLIGAPTPIAASIWAQVPGSTELTGNSQGLYAFRQYLRTAGITAG
jgi:cathepsin D